jgi:uncharacterized membrane protein
MDGIGIQRCKKSRASIFSLFLFSLLLLSLSNFVFAKSFSNPSVDAYYKLNPDGTVSVTEKITYNIVCSGDCFHELYTWHPKEMKITNASGYCIGADCRFFTQYNQGRYELVLRKDDGFASGKYIVVFNYVLEGEILKQKDASQFFYKLWYNEWPNQIDNLNIRVEFPGSLDQITYFIHPPGKSSITVTKESENTLYIQSINHPANQYLEINAVMPIGWFSNLRKADNYMTAAEIIKGEQEYIASGGSSLKDVFIYYLVWLVMLSPILVILVLYYVYGREQEFPEINTLPTYIRDISEIGDLSPSKAAILLESGIPMPELSRVIAAEIMELVRLGYLETVEKEITTVPVVNIKSKIIAFKPVEGKDLNKLTHIQRRILEFIRNNLVDGTFSFEEYEKSLRTFGFDVNALTQTYKRRLQFKNFYFGLKSSVDSILDKTYIDRTGADLAGKFFVVYLILGFSLFFFLNVKLVHDMAMIFYILYFVMLFVLSYFSQYKRDILSRWTREGRILHEKLIRYKKFMEELTLMKEKRVTDVILWEKLLVYATAFGVADKVVNAMKIQYPDYQANRSLAHFAIVSHSLPQHAASTARTSTGRSKGGFGGGRGGGGGGGGAR